MANINQRWHKAVLTGCPHGNFACPVAQDNVMAIVEDFRPDVRVCLGDLLDLAALRSGAHGTADEHASLEDDYNSGVEWLRRYRPTHRCHGNHDHRIYKLLNDRRAVLSRLAQLVVADIEAVDAENHTEVRPYHMRRGWFQFGDTLAGHGWMYNEQALRDHAETFGKCVIAHLHVPHMSSGRTLKPTPAWCVGTLADPDRLDYAQTRRNTLRWAHGLVQLEYTETQCEVRLITATCNHGEPETWA